MAIPMPAGCRCALHPSAGPRPPLPNSPPSTQARLAAAESSQAQAPNHLPWLTGNPHTCSVTATATYLTRRWLPPHPLPQPMMLLARRHTLAERRRLDPLKRSLWHLRVNISPRNVERLHGARFTCEDLRLSHCSTRR